MATNPVLTQILKEARQRRAPYKHIKAAVETGIVESGLTNVSHGDADSLGWRQERASLYPNPLNLKASVKRFFDEAQQHDSAGLSSGELAAAVQRPAAQYRGRYNQVAGRAAELINKNTTGAVQTYGTGDNSPQTGIRTNTQFDRAGYEQAQRKALVANLLARSSNTSDNPLFTSGLLSLEAPRREDFTRQLTERYAKGGGANSASAYGGSERKLQNRKPSDLLELFYDPLGGYNRGQSTGAIGGHTDHVHVAAGPKQTDALSKLAQRMGLHVADNPGFDPVEHVHAENSYHYRNMAADISGDPQQMKKFAKKVLRIYGVKR